MKEKVTLPAYPDIELGIKRRDLNFILTYPKDGIDEDTGIIFNIGGFLATSKAFEIKSDFDDETSKDSLASVYNCLTINVEFFGNYLTGKDPFNITPSQDFIANIKQIYNIDLKCCINQNNNFDLNCAFELLSKHDIKELSSQCFIYLKDRYDEYQTWGFLSAIDHIYVLSYLLKRFPNINKKKIVISGVSYGGYIGGLVTKFMPNTFSLHINNSSFVKAELKYIVPKDLSMIKYNEIKGINIPYYLYSPWTILDDNSPYYFSDSHRGIRNLLHTSHYTKSDTTHYIFHADEDDMVNINEKEKYVELLSQYADVKYYKIDKDAVDGVIFKHNQHYMDTDTRKLFDKVYELNDNNISKPTDTTDYDLDVVYGFECSNKVYNFSFSKNYDFAVWIEEV